jgi:hypothetical protein
MTDMPPDPFTEDEQGEALDAIAYAMSDSHRKALRGDPDRFVVYRPTLVLRLGLTETEPGDEDTRLAEIRAAYDRVTNAIANGHDTGTLYDENGQPIGRWTILEPHA